MTCAPVNLFVRVSLVQFAQKPSLFPSARCFKVLKGALSGLWARMGKRSCGRLNSVIGMVTIGLSTIIPTLAVVVCLSGTFIGMMALGFSINLLTLFGMVVAIGIVVDDAIVVVEAVEHNMAARHLSARDAAVRAMEEVSGPVIAVVLVLAAVFLPTAAISGTTGQLYKQFAVTIAVSVAISGFVALTLTPALCSLLAQAPSWPSSGFFWMV
jgi:multidrug efflux pump subunit AcrB